MNAWPFPVADGAADRVRVLPAWLDAADCARLVALYAAHLADEPTAERAHGRLRTDTVHQVADAVSASHLRFIEERVLAVMHHTCGHRGVQLDHGVLMRLDAGQFQALHTENEHFACAHGPHRWRDTCTQGQWRSFPGARREAGSMLFLDDAGEGGELWFPQHDRLVRPAVGTLVAWPAGRDFLREVLPVALGARHTLQAWAVHPVAS